MSQSVGQGLVNIRRNVGRIVDDVEIDWRNRTLIDFLRHQEEIEAFAQRHRVVDHRPARRIPERVSSFQEETSVDFLADNHERNAGIVMARFRNRCRFFTSFL